MARVLSPTTAVVVEDLELDQPVVVTMELLREIVARHQLGTSPKVVAARLREAGWLLPTGRRGVWEFAPGAHAGPVGHGDPVLPLRAALAADPDLPAALALSTAAWAHGWADRTPSRLDIAVPVGIRVGRALTGSMAVSTFTSTVGYIKIKGVPCHRPESVLVHLAASPTSPRSWAAISEWLPDLAADLTAETLTTELKGRPRAVSVRTGYLLSGLRPDLAAALRTLAGDVVRFGSRSEPMLRQVSSWRVLDYLLPSDPTTWEAVR